ncbi:MAG: hypothetical protein IJW48_00055 [Clostridia bacterium]|nr:hypothetical protein [Clostridia bacterium]
MLEGRGGGFGVGSAYRNYSVYSKTASYNAFHGSYYFSGRGTIGRYSAKFSIGGYGSVTVTDDMAKKSDTIKKIYWMQKTGSASKKGTHHSSFPNIVDNYAGYATKFNIKNGTLYQIKGAYRGVDGRFEWIKQNGYITHRMFVEEGGNQWYTNHTIIDLKRCPKWDFGLLGA